MALRRVRLLVLLAGAALPGCFLDEIDKSMAKYEASAPPSANKQAAPPPPAPGAAPAGGAQTAQKTGPSWWETARTLGSEPKNDQIAGCQLGGRVEFMLRDDCLARGGQPQ